MFSLNGSPNQFLGGQAVVGFMGESNRGGNGLILYAAVLIPYMLLLGVLLKFRTILEVLIITVNVISVIKRSWRRLPISALLFNHMYFRCV